LALVGAEAACSPSLRPLDPATRIDRRPATQLVLELAEPCQLLPGGAPRVRPNSVPAYHVLPAGSYRPQVEDGDGVYFASPSGVSLVEPAPRGTRTLPGGVYLAHEYRPDERAAAWQYLGDADGISSRQLLPQSCRFSVNPVSGAAPAVSTER
jgi:hypothetical protein